MLTAAGLEYEVSGAGEPVLFIHGGIVSDADLPLMSQPALSGYRLIRYHRRGFGGSAPHSGPASIAGQARDALALLQALEVRRAHVVGHSFGGVIAMQLAFDAPSVVQALVLSEPALFLKQPQARQAGSGPIAAASQRVAAGDYVGAVDVVMRGIAGEDWRSEVNKTIPGAAEQADRDAAVFPVESPALSQWPFGVDEAKAIQQPVLSIISTGHGPVASPGRQLLHEWLPQTEDCDVAGANHLLQFHSPTSSALVAEGIAAFLSRHPMTSKS